MLNNHFRLFLALFIASVLLMTYQSRTAPLRPFFFLSNSSYFINEFLVSFKTSAKNTVRRATLNEEELNLLRREVQKLRLNEQRHREVLRENRRLREALALKEQEPYYVATARVISRGGGRWSNTFVIDKGVDELVEKDMTVITPDGLLGKIIEVRESFARVLLIDDSLFSAAVRLQDGRTEAVLSGAGQRRCQLKYVEVSTVIKKGDVLVTSGLDGLFPPGIRVGYISDFSTNDKELFHDIEVITFVDSRKVEEVTIVGKNPYTSGEEAAVRK